MRIAIVSIDTRGGVQPYLGLALGLRRAGHDVRMLVPSDFVSFVQRDGIDAVGLQGSMEAVLRSSEGVTERGLVASLRFMHTKTEEHLSIWARQTLEACRDRELITGGLGGMIVGIPAAEKLSIPFLKTHLHPLGPPTASYPGLLFPRLPAWLGTTLRRWSHPIGEGLLTAPFQLALRRVRREHLGLPARASKHDPWQLPVLYGYSQHVLPKPPEWPENHELVGYWTLPLDPDWEAPADLQQFLSAGSKPVCIGFGSMNSSDPARTTELVLEAISRAGVRAVLLSGWGGLQEQQLSQQVYSTQSVPHEWLYSRVGGIVHHGGAGTTAAALRSGTPALVVPFGVDQPFWAARVEALGVGPTPIPRRALTAENLASALRQLVTDELMHTRARTLAAKLQAEDGVARTVRVIESLRLK